MPYADPAQRKIYAKAYRKREASRIRRLCQAWRERNPEHAKELQRKRDRKYRALNPIAAKAKAKRYVDLHPERESARGRSYRLAHPEIIRAKKHRRRARELASTGAFTASQWEAMRAMYEHRCLVCGGAGKLQPDHVVPLAKGGSNTIDNIQPLCGPCNRRKSDKAIDYRQARSA